MSYIGNQPVYQAFVTDQFSGNGSTTAFTMSVAPANTASVLVAVSGVLQDPSTYSVSGTTLTFSAAPPSGTGNISVRYLGIPASGVTTTAYRTLTEFTATASQTTFTPASYTVGYINVYRNGVRLGSADYTATNGTTVVLASGATAGDLVTTESFYVSSVVGAIPATNGAVTTAYLLDGGVTQAKLGTNVAGNGPAFYAYLSANQGITNATWTKVTFDTEVFDTNSNFASNRFTPTVAGYYQINARIFSDYNTTYPNNVYCGIYKNGTLFSQNAYYNSATSYGYCGLSDLVYCNGSTDYIEIYVYLGGGTSVYIDGGATTKSGVSGFLARAA